MAVALPMPEVAPVMIATLSVSRPGIMSSFGDSYAEQHDRDQRGEYARPLRSRQPLAEKDRCEEDSRTGIEGTEHRCDIQTPGLPCQHEEQVTADIKQAIEQHHPIRTALWKPALAADGHVEGEGENAAKARGDHRPEDRRTGGAVHQDEVESEANPGEEGQPKVSHMREDVFDAFLALGNEPHG